MGVKTWTRKELTLLGRDASFGWLLLVIFGISLVISLAHFLVPHHFLVIHGFLRRIYYFPIILTASLWGLKRASYVTGFIGALYLPFVVWHWGSEPLAANLEGVYELVVFGAVAATTGYLSDREKARRREVQEAYHETVVRLATAAEYKDENTGAHLHRISGYAGVIATELGLPASQVELIKQAAHMHDIGKIGIPDHILLRKGKLSEEVVRVMRTHTVIGHRILEGSPSPLLRTAASIALTHHERYDGKGYPRGIRGEEIPLAGRVVAVADVFDALTTSRPYKPAYGVAESIDMMAREKGFHLDPLVFHAFANGLNKIKAIKEGFSTGQHAHALGKQSEDADMADPSMSRKKALIMFD